MRVLCARNLTARRSFPVVARPAQAQLKRTARELARFEEFERELLRAPCPRHSALAVCDECVGPKALDSFGFPGAVAAKGRGRYRVCQPCGKLQGIGDWNFQASKCHGCAGTGVEPWHTAARSVVAEELPSSAQGAVPAGIRPDVGSRDVVKVA